MENFNHQPFTQGMILNGDEKVLDSTIVARHKKDKCGF